MHDWLLLIHILGAIVWLGGGFILAMLATRIARSSDPAEGASLARHGEWLGPRVFGPANIAVLATGLWLVGIEGEWTIGQLWIVLALIGFGISFLLGIFYYGPEGRRIGEAMRTEGPGGARTQALIRRNRTVSWLDLGVLFLLVADMVFKPGA